MPPAANFKKHFYRNKRVPCTLLFYSHILFYLKGSLPHRLFSDRENLVQTIASASSVFWISRVVSAIL